MTLDLGACAQRHQESEWTALYHQFGETDTSLSPFSFIGSSFFFQNTLSHLLLKTLLSFHTTVFALSKYPHFLCTVQKHEVRSELPDQIRSNQRQSLLLEPYYSVLL